VSTLFDKIASAKIPETFHHKFMQDTIGLKSKGDRPLIPFLRSLGFIDNSGKPTPEYSLLKGSQRRIAVADGIRKAYRSLFDADEDAWEHTGEKLRGLISQVAGTDEDMTARIANTFASVVKCGDFSGSLKKDDQKKEIQEARLLVHLRNTICHMNVIPPEELERIRQTMRDWFRVVAP
jgi:hypothetical protein